MQRGIDAALERAQAANQAMGMGGLMPNPQTVAEAASSGALTGLEQPTAEDVQMETYEDPTDYNKTIVENLRKNPIGEMLLSQSTGENQEADKKE